MNKVWCFFWTAWCVMVLLLSISDHWGGWFVAWGAANLGLWIALTVLVLKEDR